jgi:hypothetical protein
MPQVTNPYLACIAYLLRAVMLLSILAEAYTFINPASYSFLWQEWESWLSTILECVEEAIRFVVKASKFWMSAHYTLLMFGITCYTAEIKTPQDWGFLICLGLSTRVVGFRCAIPRNCWTARWVIWSLDVLDRFVDLWWIDFFANEAEIDVGGGDEDT